MSTTHYTMGPGAMAAQASAAANQAAKDPRAVRSAVNGAPVATWKGAVSK